MAEGQGSDTMAAKGRVGVYALLVFLAIVTSALITFDALNDDTAEVTEQLDPTTLENAPE